MNHVVLAQALDAIATLIERGDLRGAEQQAQSALQSFPSQGELWRLLGIAQLQSGRRPSSWACRPDSTEGGR